jgi:pimeloyl-ACP methyl ester carboxylesterase
VVHNQDGQAQQHEPSQPQSRHGQGARLPVATPAETVAAVRGYREIEALIPMHWSEGDVQSSGIRLHYYRTGGDKPPLVLLHGILAGGLTWLRIAKAFEGDFDVIMLDARGHGQSDGIASGMSYPLLVHDVAGVIRALGLERPRLLGHSMGGVTAALVAATHPELIHATVLEEGAWGDTFHLQAIGSAPGYQAWLAAYLEYLERLKTLPHEERLVAVLPHLPHGPTALWPEEELVPWVEAQARLDLDLVRLGPALWAAMRPEEPFGAVARRIACPLLLLTGNPALGGSGSPELIQETVTHVRDGQHVNFEGAGHLIHLDAFARYTAVVIAFLKEHTPG